MELKEYAERKILEADQSMDHPSWREKLFLRFLGPDSVVLDIGCWPAILSKKFWIKNYYGIDYNESFVKHWVSEWLDVRLSNLSVNDIPFQNNFFDIVYCSHVIEHLDTDRQIRVFLEIQRVLKKGGVLIMFAPTPYHWFFWDDPTHKRPVTHGSLGHLAINSWLTIIEARYSLLRQFWNSLQRLLRLTPLRFFLWEVYLLAKK